MNSKQIKKASKKRLLIIIAESEKGEFDLVGKLKFYIIN